MNKIILAFSFAFLAITVTAQDKKTVTLDYFYNNEYQTKEGKTNRFHYTWEDKAMTGYSKWGEMFKQQGAVLKSLTVAPTTANLAGTDVYIITDPDTKKETAKPNFVDKDAVKTIKKWVKAGGTLVLLANDSINCELPHFNKLANIFGIHFNDKIRNAVEKDLSVGLIVPEDGNEIFKTAKNLFLKGISTISVSKNAKALITDKGDVIMATARYGKGKVFAAGDPWIYNEYIDNDILNTYKGNTIVFENNKAAQELTTWLLLD